MKKNKNSIIILFILITILLVLILYQQKLSKNSNIAKQNVDLTKNEYTAVNISTNSKNKIKINKMEVKVPIFMYHNIANSTGTDKYVNNYLSISKLEEQIKYIKENNYQTIFVNQLENLENYQKPVALTFDDGYQNFYQNAFPILKKYNQKATLNVITQFIDKPNYVTSNQIKEMEESGLISIESHTSTHQDLLKINNELIIGELKKSQDYLKKEFNINSIVICYPSGKYNKKILEDVKESYKYGLTTTNDIYDSKIDHLLEIPRIRINRNTTMNSFIYYLKKSNIKVL